MSCITHDPNFASTFAFALSAGLQPILHRLDAINARLDGVEARQCNAGCAEDDDILTPPRRGANAPPATAPTTVAALHMLSVAHLTELETYYGLPHTDTQPACLNNT
jgi:hypothetical protein